MTKLLTCYFFSCTLFTARFQLAATSISQEFGLSLFGFDVIIPVMKPKSCELCDSNYTTMNTYSNDLDLVVIDVNFFPSYKEVVDFPNRLRTFLKSKKCHDISCSHE